MEQAFKSSLRSKERPTLSTFNSMITNYRKARLSEKANLVFQKITDMGYMPNFITSYTNANIKELLQKLLKHMDRYDIVPNKRFFIDALGGLGSSNRDSIPTKVNLRIPADKETTHSSSISADEIIK
ncbi:Pentatricopeptide repeat-containing protein [Cynara cardunculus var. scolymus]|uniref:Pentatricopeptide repeat-containing protein n=1 Tax=Cynara cardunculus var. scolymus TaxID=59895 RepID=A0A103YIR6_CYNCS|nr:Pentatricopeptide repeat-containing protein [Cynara cardunculus var. scolymus]